MSTIDINLPDELKSFVEQEVSRRGYRDASEFVQALLEAEKLRDIDRELEQSLLEALDEPSTPLTDKDFENIKREGDAEIARRRNQ